MATVARENIGLLNDKIIITVDKEDYLPTFEKKLKEYSKNVNMPGFRKGMVPTGMIRKMYGPSIYTDEVLKTVEKQLYSYLDTEKPDIFAQPLALDADIRKLDHNAPAAYEFGFEIGLKPEFTIAPLAEANLTRHQVAVTDDMVEKEIERMRLKGGNRNERPAIAGDEDYIDLQITETDAEGNDLEGGFSKETTLTFPQFAPVLQEQLKGKEKDASIVTSLEYAFDSNEQPAVLQHIGLDGQLLSDRHFRLTIRNVGELVPRELDEAFFNEVFPGGNITTEEAFRDKLRNELQEYWNSQSTNQLHDQIYHYLIDNTQMEFPAAFLKRWLQTGSEQRKTAEQAEEEFPSFSGQLKWTLISDRIVRENNLDVSQEELKEAMKAEVLRYFGGMSMGDDTSWLDSYVDRMMKDEKQVDGSYRRLITEKLFKWAESQTSPKENTVTPDELTGMQHHHH